MKRPKPHRLLEDLRKSESDSIVEIVGYVGASDESIVRIYPSLNLAHYIEVPFNSIVRIIESEEDPDQPVRIYVQSSASVQATVTVKLTTLTTDNFDYDHKWPRGLEAYLMTLFRWRQNLGIGDPADPEEFAKGLLRE